MKGPIAIALLVAVALHGANATYLPDFDSLTAGEWNYIVPGGDTGCALGDAYGFLVKKGASSPNKVMVEFEGGGSCYSWDSCGDDEAGQGSQVPYSVKMLGLTNQLVDDLEDDDNLIFPGLMAVGQEEDGTGVFDGWTKIWIPHCTQDMHIGAATMVYEDDEANDDDDDNNGDDDGDDDNKDDDDDEEEDRTITWNHNGLANAQSAVDYISNGISTSQVFMTGCGLQPITAGHWAKTINSQTGTKVTVLSDSGVGLVPSTWVQNYMGNWGAGCVVSKLLINNGNSADTSSDDFWSDTFALERLWEFVPQSSDNVKWLIWQDVSDAYAQELYDDMDVEEDENNKAGGEDYFTIKAATILSNAASTGKVKMMLYNSEMEDDEADDGEGEGEGEEEEGDDEDEGDDDDDADNNKNQKSQKSQKNRKEQDDAQCYQAGYNALRLEYGDGEGEGEGDGNKADGDTTFSDWIKNALDGTYENVLCQYCTPDTLEDCQGTVGGGVLPDACGTCPEMEEEDNGDGEGEGEGEDNNKDDDDGEGEGEGDGEGEEDAYSCEVSAPSWYKSSCSIPSFEETSGSRSNNKSSNHTSLAIFGGVVIVAVLAFFAFVNFKGNKGEKRRLVDVEKNNPTY